MAAKSEIQEDDGRWHVDKKVPLALIFAIFVQTIGVIWFMAGQNARLEALERESIRLEKRVEFQEGNARGAIERLIRLEEKTAAILELTRQIAEQSRQPRQ